MKTLILATVVLASVLVAPVAAAAPIGGCQVSELAHEALSSLGETQTEVRVVTRAQMDREERGAAAYAEPDLLVLADDQPCPFTKATVAHEVAHVWQYRSGDLVEYTNDDEIVADCAAALTGWEDHPPYLIQRGYGCSDDELASAATLREWAR